MCLFRSANPQRSNLRYPRASSTRLTILVREHVEQQSAKHYSVRLCNRRPLECSCLSEGLRSKVCRTQPSRSRNVMRLEMSMGFASTTATSLASIRACASVGVSAAASSFPLGLIAGRARQRSSREHRKPECGTGLGEQRISSLVSPHI